MPLEDLVGPNKFIADLVKEWPLGVDPQAEGDDHIRGVKNVLENTFGQLSEPIEWDAFANLVKGANSVFSAGALDVPYSSTANRPAAPTNGLLRINNETFKIESYIAGSWVQVPISNQINAFTLQQRHAVGVELELIDQAASWGADLKWRIQSGGTNYVSQRARIADEISGHAEWQLRALKAGTMSTVLQAFGDDGAGNCRINFPGAVNEVSWHDKRILTEDRVAFESALLVYANGGSVSAAHGLSYTPRLFEAVAVCQTAENGYAIGDEIKIVSASQWQADTGSGDGNQFRYGVTVSINSTTIMCSIATNGLLVVPHGGGNVVSLTPANWRIRLRAFA